MDGARQQGAPSTPTNPHQPRAFVWRGPQFAPITCFIHISLHTGSQHSFKPTTLLKKEMFNMASYLFCTSKQYLQ